MPNQIFGKKDSLNTRTNFLPILGAGMGIILLVIIAIIVRSNQEQSDLMFQGHPLPPIEVNQPAPELTLFDLDGNPISLSDFKGQVILVNNWATWCPPCRQEMPEFQAYYNQYRDQGFQVIAVEAGQPEHEVRAFVDQLGLDFVVLLDPSNLSLTTFQQTSLPNSFVLDRKGNLRLAWLGAINGATLEEYVTPLLKE
jgi:peroxiredoxin